MTRSNEGWYGQRMTSHPSSLVGTDVDVYWNLHKGAWSVRDRKTRLVVARVDAITLTDVQFKVSAAGNARVRSEGRKNVHAFARGRLETIGADVFDPAGRSITYNPYKYTTFVTADDEVPVRFARMAWLSGRTVRAVGTSQA